MSLMPLSCVSTLNMGQSPDSSSYNQNGDGLPFFQGNADFGELHPNVRYWCNSPTKVAYKGDILISVRAPIGALNIANEECCIGRGLAALTVREDIVDAHYLFFVLCSRVDDLIAKGTGSTFKAISKTTLGDTLIPVVDLDLQKRIVKKLDSVSTLIALRKQQLVNLDLVVKSRFVEMFGDPVENPMGWENPLIEETISNGKNALKAGPFGSSLKKEYYVKQGYKIYGQEQVISGDAYFGNYYISDEKYKELQSCAVQANDVLISLVGTYGKVLIIPNDYEPGVINPRLMKITFDPNKVNTIYFKHFFASKSLIEKLADKSRGGTMDILNLGIVRKLQLPLPPLSLQNRFADFVRAADKSKFAIEFAANKAHPLQIIAKEQ